MMPEGAIAIFAYRRHQHLKRIMDQISESRSSKHLSVIVFVDAIPGRNSEHDPRVVMEFENYSGLFKETVKRGSNFGLRKNILNGLDLLSSKFDFFICLEDDTIIDAAGIDSMFCFLSESEKHPENLAAVCSASFSNSRKTNAWIETDRFLSWGWGTTSNAWERFRKESCQPSSEELLGFVPKTFCWPERVLVSRTYRKIAELDSWAIEFTHWQRLNQTIVLRPSKNFLTIGKGGPSTHASWGPLLPKAGEHSALEVKILTSGKIQKYVYSWIRIGSFVSGFIYSKMSRKQD